MPKMITIASTNPENPRHQIRFEQAADWFDGFNAAKLNEAIKTGIGDATPNGIELLNQTLSAKLIGTNGSDAVEAFDPITGEHVPMVVNITVRVTRAPANESEAKRIAHQANERTVKTTARKQADAEAVERNILRAREDFKAGLQTAKTADKPVNLAEQVRSAADLLTAVQSLTGAVKALPEGK